MSPPPAPIPSHPLDRDTLGRLVRATWVAWAREQPTCKPSWLVPWEGLSEPDREVDRRIGVAVRDAVFDLLRAFLRPEADWPRPAPGAWTDLQRGPVCAVCGFEAATIVALRTHQEACHGPAPLVSPAGAGQRARVRPTLIPDLRPEDLLGTVPPPAIAVMRLPSMRRIADVWSDGVVIRKRFQDLRKGDIFRLVEMDGTIVSSDGHEWSRVVSDPRAAEGQWVLEFEAAEPPC